MVVKNCSVAFNCLHDCLFRTMRMLEWFIQDNSVAEWFLHWHFWKLIFPDDVKVTVRTERSEYQKLYWFLKYFSTGSTYNSSRGSGEGSKEKIPELPVINRGLLVGCWLFWRIVSLFTAMFTLLVHRRQLGIIRGRDRDQEKAKNPYYFPGFLLIMFHGPDGIVPGTTVPYWSRFILLANSTSYSYCSTTVPVYISRFVLKFSIRHSTSTGRTW